MIPISLKSMAIAWSLALLPGVLSAQGAGTTLSDRLQDIAERQGFAIKGLKRLEQVSVSNGGESLPDIRRLLKNYDYVMELAGPDRIRKLIILGKKRPKPARLEQPDNPQEIVVATTRQGEHHLVEVTLSGNDGAELPLTLMVDTGASLVVVPESAAEALNLHPEQFEERPLQTAKGKMQARVGRVAGIRLGAAEVPDVEVALVEDGQLGGTGLLGMNVLGRYLFILDDEKNQLILIPQERQQ
jgi:aspartyl protease family protein